MKRTPLKRTGKLKRRTPLPRSLVPLVGGLLARTSTLKRTPLKPRSDKAIAEQPLRDACMAAVRKRSGGRCEARVPGVCVGVASEGHEPGRRGGGRHLDPEQVMHLCWACHRFAHEHPQAARERGLLTQRNGGAS